MSGSLNFGCVCGGQRSTHQACPLRRIRADKHESSSAAGCPPLPQKILRQSPAAGALSPDNFHLNSTTSHETRRAAPSSPAALRLGRLHLLRPRHPRRLAAGSWLESESRGRERRFHNGPHRRPTAMGCDSLIRAGSSSYSRVQHASGSGW